MINPTERARDALCGERQTSASSTDILLKSELLLLKMLQVCRQSSAISLKPPETMNKINARHTSGWEGNTEIGPTALPGGPGQPSQQRIPLALVRIAQQPLACSCRAWSHRVRCPGVAEATGDVGWWQGQARGDGRRAGRCAAVCTVPRPSRWHSHCTILPPVVLRHGTNPTEIPIALPGLGQQSTLVSTGPASKPACPSDLFIPLCREPRLFAALPGLLTVLQASRLLQQLLKYRSLHSEISVSALRAPQDSLSYTHSCNTWV